MADIIVSRIQNRRGNRVDLPQPLAPGELGWCIDTKQLFIGGDPSEPPIGVQIFDDVALSIPTAQTIIDYQIVPVTVLGAFAEADLDDMKLAIATAFVGYDTDMVQWTGATTVYVGLPTPQSSLDYNADTDTILGAINTYGIGSGLVDFTGTFTGTAYTRPNDVGLSITIGTSGQFTVVAVEDAACIATIINIIYGFEGLATTLLNIEITDITPTIDTDVLISSLTEFTLTPSFPAWSDFPAPALSYDITTSDIFFMNYSAKMEDGANHWSQTGQLQIVSSLDQADATLSDTSTEIRNFVAGDDLDMQAVFVGPGTVKVQYRHNFAGNVLFKPYTIRWASF